MKTQGANDVVVGIPTTGPVSIDGEAHDGKSTLILFGTLKTILRDLKNAGLCEARHDQFATRAYRRRTLIEFAIGPQVVAVDAYSNGPKDEERLYTLDLEERKDSLLWTP